MSCILLLPEKIIVHSPEFFIFRLSFYTCLYINLFVSFVSVFRVKRQRIDIIGGIITGGEVFSFTKVLKKTFVVNLGMFSDM